jgi:hypothetical protein
MVYKSNLKKYTDELLKLISEGEDLQLRMHYTAYPEKITAQLKKNKKITDVDKFLKNLPSFPEKYQVWYSESLIVIKQLLPDRLKDFVRLFEKPAKRKEIAFDNYVVEDYLQGLEITRDNGWKIEVIVPSSAGIPKFEQQLNILKSVEKRLESSLFEIVQILQADLFDSELDAAMELNRKGFTRGAGAMAGVVLEAHFSQVCINHNLSVKSKNPTISDYNDLLKANNVIEIPVWRTIQHLGDLRNKCDHKKDSDPTKQEIDELISGVDKIVKTLF